ncbi:MAG: hypothetical protein JO290_02565 [Sphingomonadaceae bacterium]|nr:hypothetical protein [Sphingomonadaceae bacterium]
MAAGVAKVIVLMLMLFWTARFVIGRSAAAATRSAPRAWRRFAAVVLFGVASTIVTLAGERYLPGSGWPRAVIAVIGLVLLLGGTVLNVALSYWFAGAAVAEPAATWRRSLSASRGSLVWGLALTILAILPFMILHYALGYGAVARPGVVAGAMLLIDAVLVGFMSLIIGMANVTVAERMAGRHGLPLMLQD